MTAPPVKPSLIGKGEDGQARLIAREIRRNSQDYPWVLTRLIDQSFSTVSAARTYALEHLGAKAGEFASKWLDAPQALSGEL